MRTFRRTISWRSPPYTGAFSIGISIAPLIVHPDQVKPIRRRHRTAGFAITRLQCTREIVGAPSAFTDLDQRTSHRPHLVMQERARRCVDAQLVMVPFHIEAVERLHRRFRLAFGGPEGGEV